MLLRASQSGVRGHREVLSGVRVNIDSRLGSSLAEPASSAHACTYMYVFAAIQIRVLIGLVAAATTRERRLFRSALAQLWLLFGHIRYT